MADQKQRVHVVMAVFEHEDQAIDALKRVRAWGDHHLIDLKDITMVTRDADSKIKVRDITSHVTGRAGVGALVGGAVGLFFPPSIIVTAPAGAAVGAGYGHFRHRGLHHKEMAEAGEKLQPGQWAIIAATNDQFESEVVDGLQGLGELGEYYLDIDTGQVQEVKQQ